MQFGVPSRVHLAHSAAIQIAEDLKPRHEDVSGLESRSKHGARGSPVGVERCLVNKSLPHRIVQKIQGRVLEKAAGARILSQQIIDHSSQFTGGATFAAEEGIPL